MNELLRMSELFNNTPNRMVSPEIEVPMIAKGLATIYGKDAVLDVLKKSFSVDSLSDFMKNTDLFYALANFHREVFLKEITRRRNEKDEKWINEVTT